MADDGIALLTDLKRLSLIRSCAYCRLRS